jgi:hypothetical protein
MSRLPLDPTADRSRRAWLPCPNCDWGRGCETCVSGSNCDTHWQYLLSNQATLVHLQCPGCANVWSIDTHVPVTPRQATQSVANRLTWGTPAVARLRLKRR